MTHDEQLSTYILGNYGRYPLWPVRGAGVRVWDRDGKAYLDFAGGVAVCPIGHCHPAVVKAITEQANTLIHVSNWYCIDKQAELAQVLVEEVMEQPGKVFFCNSGAEANEGLIKLARRYGDATKRRTIITFTGSFHGRTSGAMFATGQEKIWGHFGFTPEEMGFKHVAFNDIEALRAAITPDVIAILMEPIQGESGVNAVSPEMLRAAQALCREHDMLLLLDEVQSGFGRAGELCGWRAIIPGDEIKPDGVSWAKAIGSGYPLGAFWVRDGDLAKVLGPGTHGTTYGGSPLACAVGMATLRTIIDEELCENAIQLGSHIAEAVRGWAHPAIAEVRQFGLFIGYVLSSAIKVPEGKIASIHTAKLLLDAGLMTVPAGPQVVRWLPALNITPEEAEEGLAKLRGVLDQLIA